MLSENILKQFREPSGNLGWFVGWLMSVNNTRRSLWTVHKLDFKPTDHILEIGYGPGTTISLMAKRMTTGLIEGLDHSETMFKMASKKNRAFIEQKKVRLEKGIVRDLEKADKTFDLIFGSNVHFFWKNPIEDFRILHDHLNQDGRLVMVFQPRWAKSENEIRKIAENTKRQFQLAGFKNLEVDFKEMKPVMCISVSGWNK